MSQAYETIIVEQDHGILNVTINRTQSLNALNSQVLAELQRCIDGISPDTRCIVLRGSGEKAFVAGADISEMRSMSSDDAEKFARKGQKLTETLESLPIPVIACVNGFALGGGCELALACDILLATKKAKFGQPEVHLGLIPGFGGTQRLVRRMGYAKAMELLLCGRPMDGEQAYASGLVCHLAEDSTAMESELSKIIKGILKGGPKAIAKTKALAQKSLDHSLSEGLVEEARQFAGCFVNGEGEEGMSAFLEKRVAEF